MHSRLGSVHLGLNFFFKLNFGGCNQAMGAIRIWVQLGLGCHWNEGQCTYDEGIPRVRVHLGLGHSMRCSLNKTQ